MRAALREGGVGSEGGVGGSAHTPSARKPKDPSIRILVWSAVIVGSAVPEIISREYGFGSPSSLPVIQCGLLIVAAFVLSRFQRWAGLTRFVLAIAALRFGWYVVGPWLNGTRIVQEWSQETSWGGRLLIARLCTVAGAFFMCLTLLGTRIGRRELFLRVGDLSAPSRPALLLGFRKPIPWTLFGPVLLLLFGIALPIFLYFTVHPNFAARGRLVQFLPWILAAAAFNAANEEFQFRSVLLAHLGSIVGAGEAVLLTATLFGLGHFYGQPSGPVGVLMAGFAGWIWGKSMVETGGFAWAFFIHMVQDVVIFCFLVLGTQ